MEEAAVVLPEQPGEPDPPERRAWVRFPCTLPSHCRSTAHSQVGGQWTATVQDISAGGVSLLLSRRFEPGTILVIDLQDRSGTVAHTLLGRVAWVGAREFGSWMLGCTLSRPLFNEDLQALVSPHHQAWLEERRAG